MEEATNVIINGFQYNSVVVLSYFFACFVITAIDSIVKGKFVHKFFCTSRTSLLDPLTYFRLFSHSMGHRDWRHFTNNFIKILLIGPMLEEKYGSINLLLMMIITSGIVGIANRLFSDRGVRGASDIVFMMIVLSSFVNIQGGKIPFTLVLIMIFFVFDECIDLIAKKDDNISHMGHLVGSICGLAFGILFSMGFNFETIISHYL